MSDIRPRRLVAAIALAAASLSAGTPPARAAPPATWLIVQSAADPMALVGAAAAPRAPGARVIAGSDCVEFTRGIYVLALPAGAALPRNLPPGAYLKHCTPRANTVAALGLPAVDPSFAAMREPPVNADGSDLVSRIDHGLLVRPWFSPAPNDPREGLRVAVEDIGRGSRRVIERDCTGAQVARDAQHVAVACAVEQVADAPIYRTTVYRARDLVRLRVEQRCRNPRLAAPATLTCDAQAVGPDGRVTVTPRRLRW